MNEHPPTKVKDPIWPDDLTPEEIKYYKNWTKKHSHSMKDNILLVLGGLVHIPTLLFSALEKYLDERKG